MISAAERRVLWPRAQTLTDSSILSMSIIKEKVSHRGIVGAKKNQKRDIIHMLCELILSKESFFLQDHQQLFCMWGSLEWGNCPIPQSLLHRYPKHKESKLNLPIFLPKQCILCVLLLSQPWPLLPLAYKQVTDHLISLHYQWGEQCRGFPGGVRGKEPPANAGDIRDVGSIPGLGRSPGERHGNPHQHSC